MGKIKTLEQKQAEEHEEKSKEARPFQTWKLLIIYARQSTINQFMIRAAGYPYDSSRGKAALPGTSAERYHKEQAQQE